MSCLSSPSAFRIWTWVISLTPAPKQQQQHKFWHPIPGLSKVNSLKSQEKYMYHYEFNIDCKSVKIKYHCCIDAPITYLKLLAELEYILKRNSPWIFGSNVHTMATYLPAFSAGCRNIDLLFLKVLDSINICLVWSWIRHLLFFSTLKNKFLYLFNFVLCFILVTIHIAPKHVYPK